MDIDMNEFYKIFKEYSHMSDTPELRSEADFLYTLIVGTNIEDDARREIWGLAQAYDLGMWAGEEKTN